MQPKLKKLKKLKKRYGKLTVLATHRTSGERQKALVQCKCGTKKEVLAQALTNGSTKTCGAGACRVAKVKADKTYAPRGTGALTLCELEKVWPAYHRPKTPVPLATLAQREGINRETLRSLFRSVRKAGGIEKYRSFVS